MLTRQEFLRLTAGLAAGAFVSPAFAQGAAEFYRGRTITVIVPTVPGGITDLSGRLLSRHFGRFVPGNPKLEVRNVPEGGGLALANRFAATGQNDGTLIAIIQRGMPQLRYLGDAQAKFDPLAFGWLGSMSSFANDAYMLVVNKDHPAKTVADLKRPGIVAKIGADAPGSTNRTCAIVAKSVLHLNLELVTGFNGAAVMFDSMKKGALDGQVVSINSISANQTELWRTRGVRPLLQFGRAARHKDIPDVPLANELTKDAGESALIAFAEMPLYMALPFLAPVGVPADRIAAMQTAFMAMVKDKDFLADAMKSNLDITPINGAAVRALVAKMAATPKDVLARYNAISRV